VQQFVDKLSKSLLAMAEILLSEAEKAFIHHGIQVQGTDFFY